MTMIPAQTQPFTLNGAGQVIGDTTVTLASMKDIDGNLFTMASLGTIGYATIEPNSGTAEEQISFTGITQNANGTATLTGVKTVGFLTPFTETSGLAKTHAGGVKLVLSNTSGFYNKFANTQNSETISANWTIATGFKLTLVDDPVASTDAANKHYVDNVAIAGAPNASSTVKGIVKLTLDPVSPTNPLAVGDNDSRVPTANQALALVGNNTDVAVGTGNKFVTQTGLQHSAEQYAADSSVSANTITVALSPVPTSYTDGMPVKVKVANATTGTTTINVNSLGAKTVKKYVNGAIADLISNDIIANQTVTMVYNSGLGFMILQSPIATLSVSVYKNGTTTKNATDASTTQNIAHGLGTTPKYVRITAMANNAGNTAPLQSITVYNGTTQSAVSANVLNSVLTISTSFILGVNGVGSDTQTGAVTFDGTNISIAWTKSGNPTGSYTLLWEAFA